VTGRIAHLSQAALRLAAGPGLADPADVARWLYRFGTLPRGHAIERDFGPGDDPMIVLGLTAGGRSRRLLDAAYQPTTTPGWYSFYGVGGPAPSMPACKLYVSPRPDALPDAFPAIAEAFVRAGVRSFKVGRGIEGVLRPDKIVAYFEERAHLERAVEVLGRALQGCPAQGVPFTAEAGGDGLISWGVDPLGGRLGVSWRSWITRRLAASLAAPRRRQPVDRVAIALADLRGAGVDTDRWQPIDPPAGDAAQR
jgi:hypothetical protein